MTEADREMLRNWEFKRSKSHSATEAVIQILAAAYREQENKNESYMKRRGKYKA